MIKYQLICDSEHEFEGWFRDSADYDVQSEGGLLECPMCGSVNVRKAVMAPAIARRRTSGASSKKVEFFKDMAAAANRAREYVEKNFDYVGDKFPEEARKIHYGEKDKRGIYGEATGKEIKELVDEGVGVAPLPAAKPNVDKAAAPKRTDPNKKLN
jgi:hypothetical protein